MAVPVVETFATAAPGGGGTTIVCDAPASIQPGDLLVAFVSGSFISGTPEITLGGWTAYPTFSASANCFATLTRVATSEPASYEFALGESLSVRRAAILRISGAAGVNAGPSENDGSGTTATGLGVTTTEDDCLVLLGARWGANSTDFTPSNTLVLNVNRTGVSSNAQATAGTTGNITATIANGAWLASVLAIAPATEPPNQPPTIAADTPDEAVLTPLANLEFTGNDNEGDDLRYQIQISDTSQFQDGLNVVSELTSGAGTIIHPNPVGGTTWEGHRQIDDRLGMAFQGEGTLDSIEFYFGAHETFPATTDGSYLARVYEAAGYPVNPVPPAWSATTAYAEGDVIRPTSTANQNVHFIYRCKVAGTSAGSEPTWPGNGVNWLTVSPGAEVSDGSVTWEALPGLHPVNAANESDTPTPGWLAQSEIYPYAPGTPDMNWKKLDFTGASRIRLEAGKWYMVILDWRPNNSDNNNTLATNNASLAAATSPGNVYLDGVGSNNGPRIIDDSWHIVRVETVLIDKDSGTDTGFGNTEDGGDTDPFTAGERIRYTAQSPLAEDATWHWRARANDPGGSTAWSGWTAVRSFTVAASEGEGVGVADDGTGADAIYIRVGLAADDSGGGADGFAGETETAVFDAAAAADALNLLAENLYRISDSGAGLDGLSIAVVFSAADAASALDAASSLAESMKRVTDAMAGADGLSVTVVFSATDGGTGVDALQRFEQGGIAVSMTFVLSSRRATFRLN